MAGKNAEAKDIVTTPEAPVSVSENKAEKKFSVVKLRSNSNKLFGVTTSTFDGAMYGRTEKEYSINEAKEIIDSWMHGKAGKK